MASTVSLQPEPIPLDVKVVLLGPPQLYYLLSALDEEFKELFKIAADFDDRVERTPETTLLYARFIAGVVRREKLRPLDRGGVARVIEQAARLAGDADKLSAGLRDIVDLLQEADQLAADAGKRDRDGRRGAKGDRRAVPPRRPNLSPPAGGDRPQDDPHRDRRRRDRPGQRAFGDDPRRPVFRQSEPHHRAHSLRARRGRRHRARGRARRSAAFEGCLDPQRLSRRPLWQTRPLSLNASLVFEQSYGGVDGDSASAAELFALLSALAEAPISQSFAVTGSVDQLGRIQAIGGVNEKIEGFFDACRMTGFTGRQGVIIPASNVKHLMLRRDVVAAAAEERFRVIPIETVDQGLALLTGMPAGEPDADGNYPAGTLNQRIAARLDCIRRQSRRAGSHHRLPRPDA